MDSNQYYSAMQKCLYTLNDQRISSVMLLKACSELLVRTVPKFIKGAKYVKSFRSMTSCCNGIVSVADFISFRKHISCVMQVLLLSFSIGFLF